MNSRLNHPEPPPQINSLRYALALGIELFERVQALKNAHYIPPLADSGCALVRHLCSEVTRGVQGFHIITRHAPPVVSACAALQFSGLTMQQFVESQGQATSICYERLGMAAMLLGNSESHITQTVEVGAALSRLTWLPDGCTVVMEHRLLNESELQRLRAISASKQLAVTLFSSQARPTVR